MRDCSETYNALWRSKAAAIIVAITMLVTAVLALGPSFTAEAEDGSVTIATIQCGDENLQISKFKDINQTLARFKGKSVTINMNCDWNARDKTAKGVAVSEHLVIPNGSSVTLNMNGYMIDRGLTGEAKDTSVSYGMVFLVQSGATFTVNGGSSTEAKARSHEAYVFTSAESSGFVAPSKKTFSGGLITGGNDKINAGGICMQKGSTVTLNDVTIAGCRDQSASGMEGTGGGVRIEGGDGIFTMYNSTITGCFADHGGGFYVEASGKTMIDLQNSHIDANYAKKDGGGISVHGKDVSIFGSDSTVSGNVCALHGGGIHVFSSKVLITGIAVRDNRAANGGGICSRNDAITLSNLVIEKNSASSHGGGVFVASDAATGANYEGDWEIYDSTVQNNTALTCGGLYFDDYTNQRKERRRVVAGEMIVKDNTSSDGGIRNLRIDADAWGFKRENFELTDGSEVWAGYRQVQGKSIANDVKNAVITDGRCAAYLHSEQAGFVFQFDLKKRYVDLIPEGEAEDIPAAVPVTAENANDASGKPYGGARTAKAGKVGTVSAGGVNGGTGDDSQEYNLIRGFYMHDNEDDVAAFYYSDGLFYGDPNTYNTHLGTLSLTWAFAAGYLNQNKDPQSHQNVDSADANTYYNKHAGARQFLADIGCADQDIYVNDNMVTKPGTDTIGVAIGSKELARADGTKTGDILIPVAVRGMGYEKEWASNVMLDLATDVPGGEARGFSNAANEVTKEIEYYLKKHNLEDKLRNGHVKFWVTGYSRAGATANLTSRRLVEMIAEKCRASETKSQVFGYPCEAPRGGTDNAQILSDEYYFCIHNLVNKVDPVPYVAPEQMGFKRYGVDHYIPGTPAGNPTKNEKSISGGGTGGPNKVTTYVDNEPTWTKTTEYEDQKTIMLRQLTAMDNNFVFDDYFRPRALDFVSVAHLETKRIYEEPKNHDSDGYNKAEYFVEDFMRFLMQGPPDKDWGKAVRNRDVYAKEAYTLSGKTYATIQTALRGVVKKVMGSTGNENRGFLDKAGNIQNNIPSLNLQLNWAFGKGGPSLSMASLYFNVIGNWHKLDDKQRSYWTTSLWNALKSTGALKELSPEEQAGLESSFPTILNLAFNFVDADYEYKPKRNANYGFPQWAVGSNETMMYTPTFSEHASYINSCHRPELNTAWVRSYDSWFTGNSELDGYKLDIRNYNVAAPTAYQAAKPDVPLNAGLSANNKVLASEQRIILENPDIVGEAIYYDLIDQSSGKTLASNQIYRGGIDLSIDGASSRKFQIKTYDMSYGVASGEVVYNVELYTGKHTVIVKDRPFVNERTRTFSFAEGRKAVVQAGCKDNMLFTGWKVVSKKADGTDAYQGRDIADDVFNPVDDKYDAATTFMMPNYSAGSEKFPENYQLELTAQYVERVGTVAPQFTEPISAGAVLPSSVSVSLGAGPNPKIGTYDVTWSYKDGDNMVPVSPDHPRAYKNTEYTATITIPQDIRNEIAFKTSVVVNSSLGTPVKSFVGRNGADGSVTVQIAFPATGDEGDARPGGLLNAAIEAYDLNTSQKIAGATDVAFSGLPNGLVTIVAPDVADEQFAGWNLDGTGITLADGENLQNKRIQVRMPAQQDGITGHIKATYVPLVKKVEVNLYDEQGNLFEPKNGAAAFSYAQAFVTITDKYEISRDNLEVTWSPDLPTDGIYDTTADYVVTVTIKPDSDGKVSVKKSDESTWTPINLRFIPSDDMQAEFNGNDQNLDVDEEEMTMSKVFPKALHALAAVDQPDNIEGLSYGTGEEGIRGLLPTATTVLATDGFEVDAQIEWGVIEELDNGDDAYGSKVWYATGAVAQPANFENPEDVSLGVSLFVTVDEADTALAPEASLDSGTYLYDQFTTLSTDEQGGRIYYTLDGSDPSDPNNENRVIYDEDEEIPVNRLDAALEEVPVGRMEAQSDDAEDTFEYAQRRALYVRAYTEAAGKRSSEVSTFRYEFSDIPVPEGTNYDYDAEEHVGVEAGPYYSLSLEPGSRARIDEYGNVVATIPGTYKVTASLLLSDDMWELSDGSTSSANQTIEFTIAGDPLSEDEICDIAVEAVPTEAGVVMGAGSYVKGQVVEVMAWDNEGYEFVNWTLDGEEVSRETSYEFEAFDDCKLVANFKSIDSPYYCAEGSGGIWTKGSSDSLSFTFKRTEADETTFERFVGIEVDGVEVPEKDASGAANYTTESGSLILALQPAYLETLPEGGHTVKTIFNDGDAQAAFSVTTEAPAANKTVPDATKTAPTPRKGVLSGDTMAIFALLGILAVAVIVGAVVFVRRRRI